MPLAIQTPADCVVGTEIANVGLLGAGGVNPIPLDRAAQVLPELQDDDGQALTGAALRSAAKAWAEERGLEVNNVPEIVPAEEQKAYPLGIPDPPVITAPEHAVIAPADDKNAASGSGAAANTSDKE